MRGIDVLESRPVQGENGILGRQGIAGQQRQGIEWVFGNATVEKFAVAVLNCASQLALNRLTVQIDQHRQTIHLLQGLDVLFLLKCDFQQADCALAVTAAESETTEDITEQIALHYSRCLVFAEAQSWIKKRFRVILQQWHQRGQNRGVHRPHDCNRRFAEGGCNLLHRGRHEETGVGSELIAPFGHAIYINGIL